jgi:virginiamycin B lyase
MKRIAYLLVPATLSAALSITPAHAATHQATIGEYPTPTQASSPQGMDVASDGSVWYSETAAGKIAVLHPDKTSTEYPVPNGGQPFILKVAADGIWFTDSATHAIGHLVPQSGKIVEYAIPSGASPFFIQIGADGSHWFSETAGIGRLSPKGVITEWTVTLEHPDDNIEQLSLDPNGNVWFAERNFDGAGAAGTNDVRRLNPRSNVISTYRVPTFGGNPAGVLANADGTVWVSEYYANALALLNPALAPHSDDVVMPNTLPANHQAAPVSPALSGPQRSTRTSVTPDAHAAQRSLTQGWIEYQIPTADAEAEDMRVDQRGQLWFEEDQGRLGRLDPWTAQFTEYTIPSPDSGYYNIALDRKADALWFTEAGIFAPVTTKIGYLDARH